MKPQLRRERHGVNVDNLARIGLSTLL